MYKHRDNFYIRVGALLCLLASVLFLPWWLTASVAFLCILYFDYFFEVLLVAVIFDSLYSIPSATFDSFEFVATTASLVVLLFALYMKKRLSFYSR